MLNERHINPKGMSLDKQKPPRENFVYLKSVIDTKVNTLVGRKPRERSEFTQEQLDNAQTRLDAIVAGVVEEVFNGKA